MNQVKAKRHLNSLYLHIYNWFNSQTTDCLCTYNNFVRILCNFKVFKIFRKTGYIRVFFN